MGLLNGSRIQTIFVSDVYITSVPASEGLWSSVRNVETTLIEPRPFAIRSGAYRSDAGRRG